MSAVSPTSSTETLAGDDADCTRGLSTLERWISGAPPPLITRLLDTLQLIELFRLSQTSYALYTIAKFYQYTKWDLAGFTTIWFKDPRRFIQELNNAEGVISGSQAIRFMDRLPPSPNNDLDIFVQVGGMMTLNAALLGEGYAAQTWDGTPVDNMQEHIARAIEDRQSSVSQNRAELVGVFNFRKQVQNPQLGDVNLTVQIIIVNIAPTEFIVQDFHSTAVMNVISPRRAVSIFPRATFLLRQSFTTQDVDNPKAKGWMEKYRERGFEIITRFPQPAPLEPKQGIRHVGDEETWIIELNDYDRHSIGLDEGHGGPGQTTSPRPTQFQVTLNPVEDSPDWKLSIRSTEPHLNVVGGSSAETRGMAVY